MNGFHLFKGIYLLGLSPFFHGLEEEKSNIHRAKRAAGHASGALLRAARVAGHVGHAGFVPVDPRIRRTLTASRV